MTRDELARFLRYDPDTGKFYWRVKRRNGARPGDEAGHRTARHGYIVIGVNGRHFYAHRLAWLFQTGSWPTGEIDHINLNPSDNRAANLRAATRAANIRNRGVTRRNVSGLKGVSSHQGRWRARICVDRRVFDLGCFATPEEAHLAYARASRDLHGEFARAH